MDLFTDASLNDEKKVAGIGCVCVDKTQGETSEYCAFFSVNSIHIAELCALAFAVQKAPKTSSGCVRIVSDSASAINTLHKYVKCFSGSGLSSEQKKFLRHIDASAMQKLALEKMVDIFMSSPTRFQFVHVDGHQRKTTMESDGYWNGRADEAALKGRLFGEALLQTGKMKSIEDVLNLQTSDCNDNDWRSRIHVPYILPKTKKPKTKKVSKHRAKRDSSDIRDVRIMLNLNVKVR